MNSRIIRPADLHTRQRERGLASRRGFLRAAGAAVALPMLASALPRSAWGQQPAEPIRMLFWYVPNGIQNTWFTPDNTGFGYDLKSIAAPLLPVQDHVSILSNLAQLPAEDPVPGDHARGTGAFLTCTTVRHTAGNDIQNGVSADQLAAEAFGDDTPFPSIQVGVQPGGSTGDCTAGYSCAYVRNISWSGPATPLPNATNPQLLFERMFGVDSSLTPEERVRRNTLRVSLLDGVVDQIVSLQSRLAASDVAKLDEYLTGVRELETRIQSVGGASGGSCVVPDSPPATLPYPDHVEMMSDLMALAFSCDLTRIITFQLGGAASNQAYDFIGVPGAHHQISHHQGDAKNLANLQIIGAWEVEKFASFVEKLTRVTALDGSPLLDHTLALFSSEISDGDTHSHRNLPAILAGKGGGVHAPGQHIVYPDPTPVANLYLAMLHATGLELGAFGDDGTEPIGLL